MIRPVLVFLLALVAVPTLAVAKPTRVVVGQIEGDDDGDVTAAIKDSIGADVSVVGKREVATAEDKYKLSAELTDKEVRKLLKEIDADAVVKGTLEKGDKNALHLKVYLRTSTKPKAFTLQFGDSKSDKFRATLRKTILGKLGVVEGPDPGDKKPPEEEDPPVKPKKPKKPPTEEPTSEPTDEPVKPKKPKKPKQPTDEPGDGSNSEEDDPDPPDEPVVHRQSDHTPNRDAVRVDVGASGTARQLVFASRQYPQAPKPYSNGVVPGERVEGEIYPLAFLIPKSIASGLGFAFDFDKTLSLTLRSQLADNSIVSAKAQQQRFSLGARLRFVFGSKRMAPSLTLGMSYGIRSFVVDRSALTDPNVIDVPDIQYKAYQPGLGLRVPFIPQLALIVDARAVLVMDAGPIQRQDQYGQAKVTGGQAQAGLDIVIADRFAIRIVGEYAQFGFAFVGNGTMAVNRDGDATSKDIGGASDRYFGGAATLAGVF